MERVGEKAAARQQLTCCRAIPSSFTARCGEAYGTLTVLANGSPFLYLLGSGSRVSRTIDTIPYSIYGRTVPQSLFIELCGSVIFLNSFMFIFTVACKCHTSSLMHAQCCACMDKCFHYTLLSCRLLSLPAQCYMSALC